MSGAVLEGFRLSAQQRRLWSLGSAGGRALGSSVVCVGDRRPARTGPSSAGGIRACGQARHIADDVSPQSGCAKPVSGRRRDSVAFVAGRRAFGRALDRLRPSRSSFDRKPRSTWIWSADRCFGSVWAPSPRRRHVLLITLPTFCADRQSLYAIARSLADLYGGHEEDAGNEAPIQYPDFCQWQAELLESDDDAAAAARSHWEQRSSAYRGVTAPFAGVEDGPGVPARADFLLTPSQVEGIEAFCRAANVSLADFLRAGWQTLIARTTGDTEVLVADVHEGRKLDELAEALGLFAVSLPVSARFDETPAFADVVKRGSEARRQNDEWQEYFADGIESDPANAGHRLGFEFAQRPSRRQCGGVSFSVLHDHSWTDAFAARVSCVQDAGGVRVLCETDPARLPASAARRIAGHLEPLLAAAVEKPEALAGDLPILGMEERRRILVDLNRTDSRARGARAAFTSSSKSRSSARRKLRLSSTKKSD